MIKCTNGLTISFMRSTLGSYIIMANATAAPPKTKPLLPVTAGIPPVLVVCVGSPGVVPGVITPEVGVVDGAGVRTTVWYSGQPELTGPKVL
jgi:hypothetical protein